MSTCCCGLLLLRVFINLAYHFGTSILREVSKFATPVAFESLPSAFAANRSLRTTITFTSNPRIMGEFTNGIISKIFAIGLSTLVIAVNIYFVISYVISLGIIYPAFILAVVLVGVIYLAFCAYLTLDMVRLVYILTKKSLFFHLSHV